MDIMNNPTCSEIIHSLQQSSEQEHAEMRFHEGRMDAFLVAQEIVRSIWEETVNGNRPCCIEKEHEKTNTPPCDPQRLEPEITATENN